MYRRSGLGDDNSASAAALATAGNPLTSIIPTPPTSNQNANLDWCAWCQANPFLSAFNPSCYSLNEQICSPMVVAYLQGGAPVVPSQAAIDSQIPDQTIEDSVAAAHSNAVTAAVAAAASQPLYTSGPCVAGASYNALSCFWQEHQTAIEVGGAVVLAIWAISSLGGRR